MSFILDALRKSDTQRQEQTGPALAATQRQTTNSTRPQWLPLLVGVLVLNAIIMGWILLKDSPPTKVATSPVEAAPASPAAAAARPPIPAATPATQTKAAKMPTPARTSTLPADSAATVADLNTAQASTSPATAAREPISRVTIAPAPEPPPFAESTTAQIDNEIAALPSFQQLVVSGILSMPTLRLDIHVHAVDPGKRFVFINMRKYREGERLDEGPLLETITPTGVVLVDKGNRFTLESE